MAGAIGAAALAAVGFWPVREGAFRGGPASCSTFLLRSGEAHIIGHNLDDGYEVPGLIVVNPRGIEKQNVSWEDLKVGGKRGIPRIRWVSRFASLTYNTLGREFPDGGLNEAGLYVGEMTLLGSKYPDSPGLARLYHHQWMQYLLDCWESVPQVLESLGSAAPDGHCQWHFFVADREGRAAVIEFEDGRSVIRTGSRLPIPVLGNLAYDEELKALGAYEGFGGTQPVDFSDRKSGRRFVWGAALLRDYASADGEPPVPYAFRILKQLDKGATRWSLVYDIRALRLYWRTNRAPEVRHADFSAFDLSGRTPALALDVHENTRGDAAGGFRVLSDADNQRAVREALEPWDMGFFGNALLKPRLESRLSAAAAQFRSSSP